MSAKANTRSRVGELAAAAARHPAFAGFLVMLVLLVLNAVLQPKFFSYRAIKSNFSAFTPLILASIAQGIIIISGSLDLSLGTAISLFSVCTAYIMTDTNVFPVLVLGVAIVVAASGLLNGFAIGRLGMPPLITTFATSAIFLGIAMTILPVAGGYVPKFFYRVYRADVLGFIPFPLLMLILGILIWVFFSRTRVYRYIYAIGGNEEAAYASGIKVARIRLFAHLIASVFIAMASLCVLMITATGEWRNGLGYNLNSVAAVVIGGVALTGGKGSVLGAIFGALALGLLNNVLFFAQLSSYWQVFYRGLIIVLSLGLGAIPVLLKARQKS
ncbi:MAG: ABC transporter permease [Spirochaetales bacterium]|nr:ABC transporter permease [Spirochaetales bacterium]